MSETAHLLRLERSRGLARSAASSDSAKNWTATVPLGLGSFGLGRGEPRFAVSTVSTSPCGDAACLRSSEITGHRCAGWPRGGLRALGDRLLLGRLLAAPATAVGAAPAPPGPPSGLPSQLLLPCLLPWLPLLLLPLMADPCVAFPSSRHQVSASSFKMPPHVFISSDCGSIVLPHSGSRVLS